MSWLFFWGSVSISCMYLQVFPLSVLFLQKRVLESSVQSMPVYQASQKQDEKKGLAICLLVSEFPFIFPIFSVLYSILTFYSAQGADPSSPVGTSCFLQEQARCDPTVQWDLCPHAVSTSPSCVQLCPPCPRNLPTSYPEAVCRHQAFSLPVLPCGSPLLPAFQKCSEVLCLLPCLPPAATSSLICQYRLVNVTLFIPLWLFVVGLWEGADRDS